MNLEQTSLQTFEKPAFVEPILEPKEAVPETKPEVKPVREYLGEKVSIQFQASQLTGIYIDGVLIGTYAMSRGYAYCIECKSENCTHTRKAKRIYKKIPDEWFKDGPPPEALC